MCGIAGIWNSEAADATARVAAMLEAQRHRGPDGQGTLAFAGGAAGMVRLALVDLSQRGQQPIWSPCGRAAILFNGEMYNFREHRRRLASQGYPFQSETDTEVVLALFIERGPALFDELRGMYALAIFDWRNTTPGALPELWLARDPLGIKPLYRARTSDGGVVFASELRALLAADLLPRRLSNQGLLDYLSLGYTIPPQTLVAVVESLSAGTLEHYRPGGTVAGRRFWELPDYQPCYASLDTAAGALREALDESVRLHALADAPVGAFLSGGVDSTAVVALMRQHVAQLRTYTLAFPDLPGRDEAAEAEATAHHLDCDHTTIDITGGDLLDLLPEFLDSVDQPSVDGLNTWLVSRTAAFDVKGVLSGVGGDEWFAGYAVTRRMARRSRTLSGAILGAGAQVIGPLARWLPRGTWQRRCESLSAWRSIWSLWTQPHEVFTVDAAGQLLSASGRLASLEHRLPRLAAQAGALSDAVDVACRLDVRLFLGGRVLRDSDQASMAHSLELRLPLVDVEIARIARWCDDRFKLDPRRLADRRYGHEGSKLVLRRALADLLPPDLVERPKRGFAIPLQEWLSGPLHEWLEAMCHRDLVARRGVFLPEAVDGWTRRLAAGERSVAWPQLWTLALFEDWCQKVLDAPPQRASRVEVPMSDTKSV